MAESTQQPTQHTAERTTQPSAQQPTQQPVQPTTQIHEVEQVDSEQVGRSAALMSVLVIVSRITGFLRTWGQAFALGTTLLSSCYTVASNLPNQLYELVMGGMLATSFLPVYLSAKQRDGSEEANRYASNLLSVLLLFMGVLSVAGIFFAQQFIWTQSFTASETFDSDLAVWFFRFFAIEIALYGLSAVYSGILNAERDYFWSNVAPLLNNVVCTASFFLYALLLPTNPQLAMLILAIGNPAGVAIQAIGQIPALRRHGIRLRLNIDWHDPKLIETLKIGAPTLLLTVISFATTSVMTTALLSVTDQGASIAYYARLWFTLPYAIIAIPITTAMFTELSTMAGNDDMAGFVHAIGSGARQILFFLVPFAVYLILFSRFLVGLMAVGRFEADQINPTASYLAALATSLPAYGITTYLQKVCSALRRMSYISISSLIAGVVQVVVCLTLVERFGIEMVAFSSTAFMCVVVGVTLLSLRKQLGPLDISGMAITTVKALALGLAGGVPSFFVARFIHQWLFAESASFFESLIPLAIGGVVALLITFGVATKLKVPEASFIERLLSRFIKH
ncbi:MAG: murein biosynthesis integral membrane protein MurJ [Atopobiaceae bacterium]|nr:murein biosynthesis integral membrane protein MurJ [Atopobiaceae bacterium]